MWSARQVYTLWVRIQRVSIRRCEHKHAIHGKMHVVCMLLKQAI